MDSVDDIRDIYAPYSISTSLNVFYYMLAACLVLAGIYFLYRKIRKPKIVIMPLPYEMAIRELEALRTLISLDGKAKEFAQRASTIVREYIEAQYSIFVCSKTTQEFLYYALDMSKVPIQGYRDLLKDFLSYCDLAKFARCSLDEAQMQRMLESAIRFVRESSSAKEEG